MISFFLEVGLNELDAFGGNAAAATANAAFAVSSPSDASLFAQTNFVPLDQVFDYRLFIIVLTQRIDSRR